MIGVISPASARPGSPAFQLTVTTVNRTFRSDSIVRWNGGDRMTTPVTAPIQGTVSVIGLLAEIPASDLAAAGTSAVTVFTPSLNGLGGGTSNARTFTITNPTPVINLLSPASAPEGGNAFTLDVFGQDFIMGAVVRWGGSDRTTGFVSATALTADISANDILAAGSVQVTVSNPGVFPAGNGLSNAVPFTITVGGTNPVPVLTSVSPSRPPFNTNSVTLTANGTGFVSGSVVHWNGDPRTPTTFVSATTLTARLRAGPGGGGPGDLANEGVFHVTVVNPAPGGGSSNAVPVLVGLPFDPSVDDMNGGVSGFGFGGTPSAGGRYVAFASDAMLVANDTGLFIDVFVRDMCLGVPPGCTPVTVRVSVSSAGVEGIGDSGVSDAPLAISSDGRFVAFTSFATNLAPEDVTGEAEVFVHDRDADADGIFDEPGAIATVRASRTDTGTAVAGALRAMSPDGRFVLFTTDVPAVVDDLNGGEDAYVRDRDSDGNGIYDEPGGVATVRVSVGSGGAEMDFVSPGDITSGALSGDGRFVVFSTPASNLADPAGLADIRDVYRHDRDADANGIFDETGPSARSTTCVSVDPSGQPAGVPDFVDACDISPDGRLVTFASDATNLVPGDSNQVTDVFVRDTCFGAPPGCVATTTAVSLAGAAPGTVSVSFLPAFAADGRLIVLFSDDTSGFGFYRRDLVGGALESFGLIGGTQIRPVRPSPEGAFATYTVNPGVSQIDETGFVPGPAPVPSVGPLSPASAAQGSPAFTLTVAGSDFDPRSVVRWNGSNRTTIFINRTTLRARIAASDLALPIGVAVTVFTPAPGGGPSPNGFAFTIQ